MKYCLAFIFFFLFTINLSAQKISFTDTTNEWYHLSGKKNGSNGHNTFHSTTKYYYEGDTILAGNKYQKMWLYNFSSVPPRNNIFIRSDSVNKIVYSYNYHENTEDTLYNYNLSVSDTVRSRSEVFCYVSGDTSYIKHVVTYIDSILLNNVYHKRFYFALVDNSQNYYCGAYNYTVVEGIGANTGILTPLYPRNLDYSSNTVKNGIICFKNNGNVPISDSIKFNCKDTVLSIPEAKNLNTLKIHPQPAHSYVNIELPDDIESGKLIIYNYTGSVMHQTDIRAQQLHLDISMLSQGVYLYRIVTDDATKQLYGKILIQ